MCAGSFVRSGFYGKGDEHFSQGCPLKCCVWQGTYLVLVWVVAIILAAWLAFIFPVHIEGKENHPFPSYGVLRDARNVMTEICYGQVGFQKSASWREEPPIDQKKGLSYFCFFSLKDKWIAILWLPGCPVWVQQLVAVVQSAFKPAFYLLKHEQSSCEVLMAMELWKGTLSLTKERGQHGKCYPFCTQVKNWSCYYMPEGQFWLFFAATVSLF